MKNYTESADIIERVLLDNIQIDNDYQTLPISSMISFALLVKELGVVTKNITAPIFKLIEFDEIINYMFTKDGCDVVFLDKDENDLIKIYEFFQELELPF